MPFYLYGLDIVQIALLVAGIVVASVAQARVHSAYAHYSERTTVRGYTGSQAAQTILRINGVDGVTVEPGKGRLSDHYDPRKKVIRLSPDILHSKSIAAVAIAAHEVGHAIQHRQKYFFLAFRHALVPLASFASFLAFPLILFGLLMSYAPLVDIGIYAFLAVVVFQLVTLPVEYDASRKAREALLDAGIVTQEEAPAVRKMLGAAALTYVAATAVAVLTLLRLLLLRRRN